MKKIIVTGCGGQIGRAVGREFAGDGDFELLNYGHERLDICDLACVTEAVRAVRPYAIINCAAHTRVDDCESQIEQAYRNNAVGPRNLAIASRETGAKLLHLSTDYVFDGEKGKPYTEFDRPDPQGVYAASKLAGETLVEKFAGRYFIVRTSGVYGEGHNFVRTMLALSKTHEEVKVVRDQISTPTSAAEIARLIHLLIQTENYGLFHATCAGECSWADFAAEIFRLAGLKTRVKPIASAEYPSPVKRPAYSVLDNLMLRLTTDFRLIGWKEALGAYLSEEMRR